jgi:hypothetical protein
MATIGRYAMETKAKHSDVATGKSRDLLIRNQP